MRIDNFYKVKGEGFPLVLLHGNGESHRYFIHQIRYFSKYYKVYAIDTRGHGKSPRGDELLSIDLFAEDLYYFFERNNIEKANILGFSDGGNIALSFAIKYPYMVNKLVLNGANMFEKGIISKVQRKIRKAYIVEKYIHTEEGDKRAEILNLMINSPNISIESINKLKIETLIILGTRDLIKKDHVMLMHRKLKNSVLEYVEGDHFVAYKNFKIFNEKVRKFLV